MNTAHTWNPDPRVAPVSTHFRKAMPATLANGHIGLQGSDSGLSPTRSFMAGVMDLTPDDLQRPALLPTWNALDIRLGGESLADAFAARDPLDYRQQIDTSTATLRTQYRIHLDGIEFSVAVESWLSLADENIGVIRCRLQPSADCELEIGVGGSANATVDRYPFRSLRWPHEDYPAGYGHGFLEKRMTYAWHPGHMDVVEQNASAEDACWGVSAVAAGDGPAVGVAIALEGDFRSVHNTGPSTGKLSLSLHAGENKDIVLYAAFTRDDLPQALLAKANASALAARDTGVDALFAAHRALWDERWKGDVFIEGSDDLARQVRLDLFMLYQNAPTHPRFSMQIGGLAIPVYYGNVLWDVDAYSWSGLLPFAPDLCRSTAHFRRRTLDQALLMAENAGFRGALYPWQSSPYDGSDNCPLPVYNRTYHLTFLVSRTMWLTWCVSGDRQFLRHDAWPVLRAVADFACSLARWIPWAGRYEFHEVMGVEESQGIVDNELHTAAMARWALHTALRAAAELGIQPDPLWSAVADKIHLPYNRRLERWQVHSALSDPSLRRWTETTAYFLADLPATDEQLRDALQPLDNAVDKNIEADLPWNLSFHAIAAARLGDAAALARVLRAQHSVRVDPDNFRLRCEIPGNDAGPYLTGCGSLLQGLVHGAAGLGWTEEGLEPLHKPCLPQGIDRIHFTRLRTRGGDFSATLERDGLRLESLSPAFPKFGNPSSPSFRTSEPKKTS